QEKNNQLVFYERPRLLYLLADAFTFFSLYAYWQFIRKFLYLDKEMPALGKFTKYTSWAILLFLAFNLFYAFAIGNLMGLIAIDTAAGIVLLVAGSYTLIRIGKLHSRLRKFIYGGIFSMLLFYGLGSLYEFIRDTEWDVFPDLGGAIPF